MTNSNPKDHQDFGTFLKERIANMTPEEREQHRRDAKIQNRLDLEGVDDDWLEVLELGEERFDDYSEIMDEIASRQKK